MYFQPGQDITDPVIEMRRRRTLPTPFVSPAFRCKLLCGSPGLAYSWFRHDLAICCLLLPCSGEAPGVSFVRLALRIGRALSLAAASSLESARSARGILGGDPGISEKFLSWPVAVASSMSISVRVAVSYRV